MDMFISELDLNQVQFCHHLKFLNKVGVEEKRGQKFKAKRKKKKKIDSPKYHGTNEACQPLHSCHGQLRQTIEN